MYIYINVYKEMKETMYIYVIWYCIYVISQLVNYKFIVK